MKEKFYATVMPFIGEILIFEDEKEWDRWLAFEDDMTKWSAEIGETNDECRIPISKDDVNRLFLDCEPEIIERPDENCSIMFSPLVQRSAIITIQARKRLALNNVAPLTGSELLSLLPLVDFAEALK